MRKQPVIDELAKLQHYIKRFCPELRNVKFNTNKFNNISGEQEEELIAEYIENIRTLAADDDWIN